jgi:flagellar biosynthesis GTPase FlhF
MKTKTTNLEAILEKSVKKSLEDAAASTSVKESKKSTKKSKTKTSETAAKEELVQETANQQANSIVEKVVSNREVKWLYPEDCNDPLSRKTWRQKTRNKLHKLERDMLRIQDQNSKEFKEAEAAFIAFRDSHLKQGQTA